MQNITAWEGPHCKISLNLLFERYPVYQSWIQLDHISFIRTSVRHKYTNLLSSITCYDSQLFILCWAYFLTMQQSLLYEFSLVLVKNRIIQKGDDTFFFLPPLFHVINYGKVVMNSLGKPLRVITNTKSWSKCIFLWLYKMKEQNTPKWRYDDAVIQTLRISLVTVLSHAYLSTAFCDFLNAIIYLTWL